MEDGDVERGTREQERREEIDTPLLEGREERQGRDGEKNGDKLRKICILVGIGVVFLAMAAVVTLAFVVPVVGQKIMDMSSLNVLRMHMKKPTNTSLTLNATVELHDTGFFSATVSDFLAQVHHEGIELGRLKMPELDVVGGEPLHFTMESEMQVTNVTAFTEATAKILQGIGGVWMIVGEPQVRFSIAGLNREFKVKLNKEFLVPATLLENVVADNTTILEASGQDFLSIASITSLFSSSILELYHMGLFIFDLEVLVDASTGMILSDIESFNDRENGDRRLAVAVKLGQVSMHDFDLRQGVNIMVAEGRVERNPKNEDVLSKFMSAFLDGHPQRAVIRGPVHAASPFLNNVVTQVLTFKGLPERPIEASYIDAHTLNGFSVRLGDSNDSVHYRGTLVVGRNPLNRAVAERDIVTRVHFSEPLGFLLNNALLGKWTCETSTAMGELFSAPGMYEGNPTRPAVVDMPPGERVTFFLPGRPLPGQIKQSPCKVMGIAVAGEYDCCMVAVQSAAACRAKARGKQTFDVDIESAFNLTVGNFTLALRSKQFRTPTMFSDEMTQGFLLDAELKCSDFVFL